MRQSTREERQALTDSWNLAYPDGLDDEEREWIKEAERQHWRNLEDKPEWLHEDFDLQGARGDYHKHEPHSICVKDRR